MSSSNHPPIETGDLCSLLSNDERQIVLSSLFDQEPTTIDGLVTCLETAHAESQSDSPPPSDRQHFEVALVHNHLPRLADYGIIEYDQRNGDVVLTDTGTELENYLDAIDHQTLAPLNLRSSI